MAQCHFMYGRFQAFRGDTRRKAHVTQITIVAHPIGTTPFIHTIHRNQHIKPQMRVLRNIFKYAPDRQLHSRHIVRSDLNPVYRIDAPHLLSQWTRDHGVPGTSQHLSRVTQQNRPLQNIEHIAICHQDIISKIAFFFRRLECRSFTGNICQASCLLDTRNFSLHPACHSPRNLRKVATSICRNKTFSQSIDTISIRIERIIRLFKIDFRNQDQSDR